jgi:hypothetical protein
MRKLFLAGILLRFVAVGFASAEQGALPSAPAKAIAARGPVQIRQAIMKAVGQRRLPACV